VSDHAHAEFVHASVGEFAGLARWTIAERHVAQDRRKLYVMQDVAQICVPRLSCPKRSFKVALICVQPVRLGPPVVDVDGLPCTVRRRGLASSHPCVIPDEPSNRVSVTLASMTGVSHAAAPRLAPKLLACQTRTSRRGDIPLADEGLVVALLCADAQATVGPATSASEQDATPDDLTRLRDVNEVLYRACRTFSACEPRSRQYPDTVIAILLEARTAPAGPGARGADTRAGLLRKMRQSMRLETSYGRSRLVTKCRTGF
jgi:hypothetical protein